MNKYFSDQINSLSVSNSRYYFPLFVLWPFLAFITALVNFHNKESRKIVYLFLVYFGLTFILSNEGYVDASGYALNLKTNAALPFSDFFKIVGGIYTTDNSVDIVESFISFVVSRFTDDHRILFAVFAGVFGFFYLKSIKLLYCRYLENSGWDSAIHLAFFTLILPITAINGFRMWTAAWIFFYGAYHLVLFRKPKFLVVAAAASLVHWSFISANIILIIYFLAGNRNYIYLPLVFTSFVVPRISTPVFQKISLFFGGAIQYRYEGYSFEEYGRLVEQEMEQASWFLKIGNYLVFYYLLLSIIIIRFKISPEKNKAENNLFSFLLLFLSFVNFGMTIPSFGNRFLIVFFLFASLYIFLYFCKHSSRNVTWLTLLGLFPFLLYVLVTFRMGASSINAWVLAPGLGLPLFMADLSVYDFLFR